MRWIIFIFCLALFACGDDSSESNNANSNNANSNNVNNSNNANNSNNVNNTNNQSTNNTNSCMPMTCEDLAVACGSADDGCGAILDCGACADGFRCNASACETGIGEACESDDDCAGSLACRQESDAGWTDGYCSKDCTSDDDCGEGSHCDGESCVKNCDGAADCRAPEYGCFDGDDDEVTECLPLGTGTGEVGDPCTSYADCGGGEVGACIVEMGANFIGGYCTITGCTIESGCPGDDHCLEATSPSLCLEDCATTTCRDGYQCAMTTESGLACVPDNL